MVHVNALASVVAAHPIGLEESIATLCALAPERARPRLRQGLTAAGNRTRYTVLPAAALARLGGAGERGALYRTHATALATQAVAALADRGVLDAAALTTVVCVSGTGSAVPAIDTQLVRRFGLAAHCRRIALGQLGCGGGVAALALAAELVRHDAGQRVLVVSTEVPSLQVQVGEASFREWLAAGQFGDGAAAAVVSRAPGGPAVVATRSVLLPEVAEGGQVEPCETGVRLRAAGGLPRLIRARVGGLVTAFLGPQGPPVAALGAVLAHPRGAEVLQAVGEGLGLAPRQLAAAWAAWADSGNMVSASVFRALAHHEAAGPAPQGASGLLVAFGTGVACELARLEWTGVPAVVAAV